jgi:hypothetical protein
MDPIMDFRSHLSPHGLDSCLDEVYEAAVQM